MAHYAMTSLKLFKDKVILDMAEIHITNPGFPQSTYKKLGETKMVA